MSSKPYRLVLITLLVCISLDISIEPAQAQYENIGISHGQVTGIFVAVAAIGAGLGVGIYFLARRAPSITGCTASGPGGLTLEDENNHQTFTLAGDTLDLKTGNRLRVAGKKKKKDASGNRSFVVSKLKRDFGPCKVHAQPSAP